MKSFPNLSSIANAVGKAAIRQVSRHVVVFQNMVIVIGGPQDVFCHL